MGFIDKTPEGRYRAYFRDPAGKQRSKTFRVKKDATAFLAEIENSKTRGAYVSPHAGRVLFADHAAQWMATWNTEITTVARDRAIMRTHVLPRWGDVQLVEDRPHRAAGVGDGAGQASLAGHGRRGAAADLGGPPVGGAKPAHPVQPGRGGARAPHPDPGHRRAGHQPGRPAGPTAARPCHRATAPSSPLRRAPGCGGARQPDCAPTRSTSTGLALSVIRTVVEVGGHTTFKPYPKSRAGRRTIPLPGWLVPIIRTHLAEWPAEDNGPIFANEVGGPLRRTLFRTRIWRPSLVRAGLLGAVVQLGRREWEAQWTDAEGAKHTERLRSETAAVNHVARHQAGGLRFHDLRHSYATWLVDDGVPPNMVQRVMGHERSSTTLDLYTRRTDNSARILRALDDGSYGSTTGSARPPE